MIDSGISEKIPDLSNYVVHSTGFDINSEGYISENATMPVRNLHGTTVALIIRHICSDVEFISINILDENLSSDGRVLIYALRKVFDYKPDIIHMSLGTLKKRYIFPLSKIAKEAKRQNIHIVAASENSGEVSYPACLKNVFGVKSANFDDYMQYFYKEGFFYAPGGTEGVDSIQKIPCIKNTRGTSLSAAYISGHLARILKDNNSISFKETEEALIQNQLEK